MKKKTPLRKSRPFKELLRGLARYRATTSGGGDDHDVEEEGGKRYICVPSCLLRVT
jgi:hypothetical protein